VSEAKTEIICDTHIWYGFRDKAPEGEFLEKYAPIATFLKIDEFAKSYKVIRSIDEVRAAILAVGEYSYNGSLIYDPPLIYLKKLSEPDFEYDTYANLRGILNFTQDIANGKELSEDKIEEFRKYCELREKWLQDAVDIFNDEAAVIQARIRDKKKHRAEDSTLLNREFISWYAGQVTKTDGLSDDFDWTQIELFGKVLKILFNDLELGAIRLKPNDWYDLFLLVYVNPNRKVWTNDNRWTRYIKERLGLERYLYETQ